MKVTKVIIRLSDLEFKLADCSVVFDSVFNIDGIEILRGECGPYIQMSNIAYSIDEKFREYLEKEIFEAYVQEVEKKPKRPRLKLIW